MTRGLTTARAAALCLAASVALLVAVHVFQVLGYEPCWLCLKQRQVHWAAIAVALATLILTLRWSGFARIAALLLALVYLGSAGLAAYHAGVEYHWWPAPPCAAMGGPITGDDLLASLNEPTRAVPCDQAAWRWLGVSMAGYNFLISLLLAAIAAWGARPQQRSIFR